MRKCSSCIIRFTCPFFSKSWLLYVLLLLILFNNFSFLVFQGLTTALSRASELTSSIDFCRTSSRSSVASSLSRANTSSFFRKEIGLLKDLLTRRGVSSLDATGELLLLLSRSEFRLIFFSSKVSQLPSYKRTESKQPNGIFVFYHTIN